MRLLCLALLAVVMITGSAADAGVYNIHLATDNVPDFTDLPSMVRSATDAWESPRDKAIAVWRWARRTRRQTSCATEDGRLIWDPILHFNSYGALNCGIVSSLNITAWRELGYRGRYIQLGDHTVSEVSWNDGKTWHLFDSSMSVFCFNHEGQVASCDEIKSAAGCELSGGKSEPGHYYFYHVAPQCGSHLGPTGWRMAGDHPVHYQRTLAKGAESYTDGFSIDRYCQYARSGHRYTLNLRPYESYTRYWTGLDKAPDASKELAYFRPMSKGDDPDLQHGLKNFRANGRWVFKPDLAAKNARTIFYEDRNIALKSEDKTGPAIHPAKGGEVAYAVFKVYAANVITAMHIDAAGLTGDGDTLKVSISRDAGIHYSPVWQASGPGAQKIALNLRDEVAGVTQCLVKIEMQSAKPQGVGLDSLAIMTVTQVNRLGLPKLTLGSNEVLLRADEQVETAELWPALHNNAYKATVSQEDNVTTDAKADGIYKSTLGAAVNGRECSVTWTLGVPSDITAVSYAVVNTARSPAASLALKNSWDGQTYEAFHSKTGGEFPADEQVHKTFSGAAVPAGTRQASLRGVFQARSGGGTYNMPGIQDVLMRISHKPRDAQFAPIEVTYCWVEHRETGDVTRAHSERVASLPHRYTINTTGRRDPTMLWVRVNLEGQGPEGAVQRWGYADGQDVGPGAEPKKVAYRWGESIALNKPYTASRPSSKESGNPDTDGKELTNGIVIAPTDYVTSKSVQSATAFWDAGEPVTITVDLQKSARVAGVRVSTHQPNAKYNHPASVAVSVSEDGVAWQPAGTIAHDDLWKPPGDYEAWEHDDTPDYAALPAGGRLAYSYPLVLEKAASARYVRFVFTPLAGRGMGISEVGVFDQVEVKAWPREIVLPK